MNFATFATFSSHNNFFSDLHNIEFPRHLLFLKNILFLSFFFLKNISFWVIQNSCNLSPSTEDWNYCLTWNKARNINRFAHFKYPRDLDFWIFAIFNSSDILFKATERKLSRFSRSFLRVTFYSFKVCFSQYFC